MNAAVPDPSKVLLLSGGEDRQDLPKKLDKPSGRFFVSNVNWRVFFGHRMFGLPRDDRGTAFEESYTPTFRSMFSYFARRWGSGGFVAAERRQRSNVDGTGR